MVKSMGIFRTEIFLFPPKKRWVSSVFFKDLTCSKHLQPFTWTIFWFEDGWKAKWGIPWANVPMPPTTNSAKEPGTFGTSLGAIRNWAPVVGHLYSPHRAQPKDFSFPKATGGNSQVARNNLRVASKKRCKEVVEKPSDITIKWITLFDAVFVCFLDDSQLFGERNLALFLEWQQKFAEIYSWTWLGENPLEGIWSRHYLLGNLQQPSHSLYSCGFLPLQKSGPNFRCFCESRWFFLGCRQMGLDAIPFQSPCVCWNRS